MSDHKKAECFNLLGLLQSMSEVKEMYWKKHGSVLSLTLTGCDGGQKDASSAPNNVLQSDWTTSAQSIVSIKPGLGRPCVETELAATEKSATDGDQSVTTLGRHKRAYHCIQLVADRKYPVAESRPCSTKIKLTFSKNGSRHTAT